MHAVFARRAAAPVLAAALVLAAAPALAHEVAGEHGGFASGFIHPLLGLDHAAAMVAVGLWGAVLGRPAVWVLPIAFPLVMEVGAMLGLLSVPLPAVETGIAASALAIGLLVALWVRLPAPAAALIVGAFAIFHGHAHGAEMPAATSPLPYAVGFVVGTGLLHLAGVALGLLAEGETGRKAVRAGGGLIALAGAAFLAGLA